MKNLVVLALLAAASCHHPMFAATPAKVAGAWQLNMNTPHGPMSATLDLKQDGARLTGTLNSEHTGSVAVTGSVDDQAIALSFEVQGMSFKMTGTVDGGKMGGSIEGIEGTWSGTRPQQNLLGSVAGIDPELLEFTVKADSGAQQRFRVGPETEVLQIAPGEQDLSKGKPGRVTDVAVGDRVLVSFVSGLSEARRMVLVSTDDIARRNAAEKLDWQKRGITGTVVAKNAEEVVVETRTVSGAKRTTVVVTAKTRLRQYAPDSVAFAAARMSALDAVEIGDQFRARGNRTEDGARMIAEDAVFGTFLTKVGKVVAVDAGARVVRIEELVGRTPLTVKISPATELKTMAAARATTGTGHQPTSSSDIVSMLRQMPTAKLAELKPGSAVIVTATRGSRAGEVTAILLLANIDMLLQMAQAQAAAEGISITDAMGAMHGGILSGPSGLSLPAILQ